MYKVVAVFCVVSVFVTNAAEIRVCICNKDETAQLPVLNSTDLHAFVIGYLYPLQCRTYVSTLAEHPSWLRIQINGLQGYIVHSRDHILIAECPGSGEVLQTASPHVTTDIPIHGHHGCVTPNITSDMKGDISQCPAQAVQATEKCHVLTRHGNTCYEFSNGKSTWKHARDKCTERGGHLVTIHNAKENQYIQNLLGQININAVWIGLQDINKEGHFQWVNGEQLTYQHFSDHSIHDANGPDNVQDCVAMKSTGLWEDSHCGFKSDHVSAKHSYVCEYEVSNFGTNVIG